MDTFLWVLQWLLAVAFLAAGAQKLFTPYDKMVEDERSAWVRDTGPRVVRLAGTTEVAASLGLVLPGLTGIAPILTPLAGFGLAVQMAIAALWIHVPRKETPMVVVNVVLALLALTVAIGRLVEPL